MISQHLRQSTPLQFTINGLEFENLEFRIDCNLHKAS
jgi:hypothetical protein